MNYTLCVFDIDGVLNPAGAPVDKESIMAIKKLESHDLKISFASGKHPWYITGGLVFSGLLREDTIIIGETGGHVFFPDQKKSMLYTKYLTDIKKLKKIVYENNVFEYPFWEEPKETLFTVFPRKWDTVPYFENTLQKIIKEKHLNLYTISHVDALDTIQNGLSKKVGLEILSNYTDISLDEMIAFGDGRNDLEMLSCVGYPVAVANAEEKIKEVVKNRGGYISSKKYGKGVLEAVNHILNDIMDKKNC